jgi:hypothetical protein
MSQSVLAVGRKVLIHPSAVVDIDHTREELRAALTRQQVESSPGIRADEKLSNAVEGRLFTHYGWDPGWDVSSRFAETSEALPALPGSRWRVGGQSDYRGRHADRLCAGLD